MAPTPRSKKCGLTTCVSKIDDVGNSVCCSVCKKNFHITCVNLDKEESDLVKNCKSKGIFWKCENCVIEQPSLGTLMSKMSTIEKYLSNKFDELDNKFLKVNEQLQHHSEKNAPNLQDLNKAHNSDPILIQTEDQSNDKIIPESNPSNFFNQQNNEIENKVCIHYKKGKCRYGSSGRRQI